MGHYKTFTEKKEEHSLKDIIALLKKGSMASLVLLQSKKI